MTSNEIQPECPHGRRSCEWIDEYQLQRQQISQLSELVATDALTGLYNYRYFCNALQSEMDRSKRNGIPTSLVMVDVDHFKQVNDTHGHEAGNAVLKQIACILRSELRTTDIICRYGGEEFAMIFPETHLNIAVKVADRVRETVATTPMQIEDVELKVTVSMGASVYLKTSIAIIEDFVDSVDKHLYEAKQSGRNCICHVDYADLHALTEVSVDERMMLFNLK